MVCKKRVRRVSSCRRDTYGPASDASKCGAGGYPERALHQSDQGARGERDAADNRLLGGSCAALDQAARSADMQERAHDIKEGKTGPQEKHNRKQQKGNEENNMETVKIQNKERTVCLNGHRQEKGEQHVQEKASHSV